MAISTLYIFYDKKGKMRLSVDLKQENTENMTSVLLDYRYHHVQ